MDLSIIVNIVLCILSFILALISTLTVVITLRQNHKMIENESRPYLSIYGTHTHISRIEYYLVIKNFGRSSTVIQEFSCDIDLHSLVDSFADIHPLDGIVGTSLAPGQSIKTCINIEKASKECPHFNFYIKYTYGKKIYEEHIPFNLEYTHSFLSTRINSKRNINSKPVPLSHELDIISRVLQDIDSQLL